jgi:hypothetical protein
MALFFLLHGSILFFHGSALSFLSTKTQRELKRRAGQVVFVLHILKGIVSQDES